MDHPLRSDTQKVLRNRVVQLLNSGFNIIKNSNIVFVCGGNQAEDKRSEFEKIFTDLLPKYEFFKPEFAMENYFSYADDDPFDIADFEALVADLSIAIVLFPEAPGSFAELGYFSGQQELATKTLLVLDSNHQKSGSFISLGPASKIAQKSIFKMPIQMDYKNPDFSLISTRLQEHTKITGRKRHFSPPTFKDLSSFELFALIHRIVDILVIATGEDIESLLRSMFESKLSPSRIKKILSILVGSGRLYEVGEFGHLAASKQRAFALSHVDGAKTEFTEITVEISASLLELNDGFAPILGKLD
ncbi:MAG: retron St85 family effector protein [Paracoccaceae bacterium]